MLPDLETLVYMSSDNTHLQAVIDKKSIPLLSDATLRREEEVIGVGSVMERCAWCPVWSRALLCEGRLSRPQDRYRSLIDKAKNSPATP